MGGYFRIDLFSHHFTLTQVSPAGRAVIESFRKEYVVYAWVKVGRTFERQPIKTYGARCKDGSEFRFHIHQYPHFQRHLANNEVVPHTYTVIEHVPAPGYPVEVSLLPKWVLRDYQVPAVDYLVSPDPAPMKLLELQPGRGKSLSAAAAWARKGVRIAVVLKPQFMEKWVDDFDKYCGIPKKDICVIQGAASLMALLAEAKAGTVTEKVFIFSNRTLQQWFKLYEEHGHHIFEMGYDVLPGELFQALGVGVRLIDEVHLDFHLFFKVDLYTHVEHAMSLSATLISDDPFVTRMHEIAYPKAYRYAGEAYLKYVHAIAWIYRFDNPNLIRTKAYGAMAYSHHEFEKSIRRYPGLKRAYFDMIAASVRMYFLDRDYQKGDHCLLYVAGVEFATEVTDYLKDQFSDKDVRRYVEEDPYENLMDSEICVSNLLSAGTGHDIASLTTVILTPAVKSSASNIQGFGRIRDIPGRRLKFVYFVAQDVPKHIEYHEKKRELLQTRALHYTPYHYPPFLR